MNLDGKHTPGPWKTDGVISDGSVSVFHNGPLVYVKDNGAGAENQIANACLIASAPELLSILEELLGDSDKDTYGYEAASNALNDDWRARACAAVKNARTPQAL